MPVDRPTFSESWYRVAAIRPRLRSTVQMHRQYFRGQMWHVVQDPSNNQFFRLNDPAYTFVAMLDGRRTVADVWKICNEELGDSAPTQGEAIQLLGQLYTSNLLQAELPPDAEGLFRRYRKRVGREVRGYLMNLLFIRIPFLDPDHFLEAFLPLFGWIFSWAGLIVWGALLAVGGYFVINNLGELSSQSASIFSQGKLAQNLPLMYLGFIIIKACHEFGHAFACKKFGKQSGSGGEVHAMGIMFLVFMPMPYVDASSSSAFRSKWHRIIVGAAGMWVELGIASICAVIWARTSPQSALHALMYNMMFLASVATVLFNSNPLLRYDAYYMLSDLLEIPNLAQRSKQYIYYLVKKYVWAVRRPINPGHTGGEKIWMVCYGVASTIYRTFICVAILLFVADKLFKVGLVLAAAAFIAWVMVPLVKFIHYLVSSGELMRVRGRAALTTLAFVVLAVGVLGLWRMPDRYRIEGIVEPARFRFIHTLADGFVQDVLPSGREVQADQSILVRAENPETEAMLKQLQAERARLVAMKQTAQTEELSSAQHWERAIAALDVEIARVQKELNDLQLKAPLKGMWLCPEADRLSGRYIQRGQNVGVVIDPNEMIIRGIIVQQVPLDELFDERNDKVLAPDVEVRLKGQPQHFVRAEITQVLKAAQQQLPSPALSLTAGGQMATNPEDKHGTEATERFYEVRIGCPKDAGVPLMYGQRVVVRLELPSKSLAAQWWRSILELVQRRFHM